MRKPNSLVRLVGGAIIALGLGACSTDPVAPTEGPALVKGGVTFTEFTATYFATGLVDPGTQKIADGVVETRGLTVTGLVVSGTLGISCNAVVEINSDLLLSNATGPVWGKMVQCLTNDGGVWDGGAWAGSFQGYRVMVPTGPATANWVMTTKLVFRGISGNALGYQVRATQVATSNSPTDLGLTADITGVLFNPNAPPLP